MIENIIPETCDFYIIVVSYYWILRLEMRMEMFQ